MQELITLKKKWVSSAKGAIGGWNNLLLTYESSGPNPRFIVKFNQHKTLEVAELRPHLVVIKQKKAPRGVYYSTKPTNSNAITPVKLPNRTAIMRATHHYPTGLSNAADTSDYRSRSTKVVEKMRSAPMSYLYPDKKRLLWVNKQIILPTKTPITIITNSFDVIHSWFIPGLALKLDCIPGRSTHHTIYIENPGYYYGQCAEICGRRHHHMPIKIYAVPFNEFLFW